MRKRINLFCQVINLGKRLTDFGTATLEIDWPKETEQGKWLLYLMNINSMGVDQIKCTPSAEINPLNKVSQKKFEKPKMVFYYFMQFYHPLKRLKF